jgi:alpha/beta superfamily hydrolase
VADEPIVCRSTDGLDLEAVAHQPDSPTRAFVFCHPHPQMGGTMNAPLLLAVQERLASEGWAVLRFNFRGIGASEGTSGDGIPEVADAEGAVATARERWPGLPIAIGGWSFGAAVAIRVAARDPSLVACAAIAPAVSPRPGVTAGVPDPGEASFSSPVLVVCGSNDKQVTTSEVKGWAERSGARYVEIAGANHFFWAKYDQLAGIVSEWLGDIVKAG